MLVRYWRGDYLLEQMARYSWGRPSSDLGTTHVDIDLQAVNNETVQSAFSGRSEVDAAVMVHDGASSVARSHPSYQANK